MMLYAPWLVFGAGMLLSVHFHRGRPFLALLLGFLFYLLFGQFGAGELWGVVLLPTLASLLPFNLALLSFMREKSPLSPAGKIRLVFILLQVGALFWLVRFQGAYLPVLRLLHASPVALPPLPLPQVPLFALIAGLVVTGLRGRRTGSPIDRALFCACAGLALAVADSAERVPLLSLAVGLVLLLALLRESYSLAFGDELTGLPARRALNELFQRIGKKFTVAMVDVDHFKSFNDRYGHDVGDQVLKIVARKLAEVGGSGRVFRYGGEEFTVVFPGKSSRETVPFLDRIRREIESYPFSVRGAGRPEDPEEGKKRRGEASAGTTATITVSIGVAESSERENDPHEVLKMADKALYRAKNGGRNRISR